MKQKLVILVTMITVLGFCSPFVASASAVGLDKNEVASPINQEVDVLDKFEKSEFFQIDKTGEETILTITWENFNKYLISIGLEEYVIEPSYVSNATTRAGIDGVFKIVWHGQARNGNVDLYLPASWMNNAKNLGFNFIVGALGALVAGAFGAGVLNAIANQINISQHTYGRVFVVRNFSYQYFYYQ